MDNDNSGFLGIWLLILIYIVINFYYKKYNNIIIFTITLVATFNLCENKINALILAYIISIGYGILKNFHLLENFDNITLVETDKEITNNNSNSNNNNNSINLATIKNIKNNTNTNTNTNTNVDEIISERMLQNFVKKIKTEDSSLISYDEFRSNSDLNPIISTLKKDKIYEIVDKFKNGSTEVFNKPLIISNDNFILDGHYIWYAHKLLLIEKENSGDEIFKSLPENLNVTVLKYPIKVVISLLKNYSIEYKEELISQFQIDDNVLDELREAINLLDNSKEKLKNFYVKISNAIELV